MAGSNEEELRSAAIEGDLSKIKSLVENGTKQTANEEGQTPIFLASSVYITEPRYVEVVRALLDADDTTINVKTKEGDAPVHNAASNGNLEIMELLLEYGADLDLEDQHGMVPLGIAAMKKHHALVTMVIENLQENKKFTERQVKWMFSAKEDAQQLSIFRAIAGILKIRSVIIPLLKFNLLGAITKGLTQHKKPNLQTLGLQLLKQIVATKEGQESAKKEGVAKLIEDLLKSNEQDLVLNHLGQEVLTALK